MTISFNTNNKSDIKLQGQIATRAVEMGHVKYRIDVMMDLAALNDPANGGDIHVDLQKLFDADDFTFKHDILGITHHMDRDDNSPTVGRLRNGFVPRCLKHDLGTDGEHGGGDAINLAQPRTGNHMSVAKLVEQHAQMTNVLKRVKDMNEKALPKFNWGASHLDATAIALLNEVPGEVNAALSAISAN